MSKPWPDEGYYNGAGMPSWRDRPAQACHLTATTSEHVTYTQRREAKEYTFLFTLPSVRHNEVDGRVILPKTAFFSGGAPRAANLWNLRILDLCPTRSVGRREFMTPFA